MNPSTETSSTQTWPLKVAAGVAGLMVFALIAAVAVIPGAASLLFVLATGSGSFSDPNSASGCAPTAAVGGAVAPVDPGTGWPADPSLGRQPTAEQVGNAQAIVDAGREMAIPEFGIVVALATAAQESTWVAVGHGDSAGPDSRGLFQQRDPWGPLAVRMDPKGSAKLFYAALQKVDGWEKLPLGKAAQKVQRSADPDGAWYSKHEQLARFAYAKLSGNAPAPAGGDAAAVVAAPSQCGSTGATMNCPVSRFPGIEGKLTPDGQRTLRCASQTFPEIATIGGVGDRPAGVDDDHQTGRALDLMIPDWQGPGKAAGDRIAAWAWDHRAELGVKYVIWDARIISVARIGEGWRPYDYPAARGTDNPTLQHRDHVHISVFGDAAADVAASGAPGEWMMPLDSYTVTKRFGDVGSRWVRGHTGNDLAAPMGTPIKAAATGVISESHWNSAYGNWSCIRPADAADLDICYAHQIKAETQVGQQVKAGDVMGHVGTTGNSTGAHLHLEVRRGGVAGDPFAAFAAHGVVARG